MKFRDMGKTARIPVRVRDGKIEFLYDADFPELQEGAIGDLIVDIADVKDGKWQGFLVGEEKVEIAPAGTVVIFGMATNKGADKHLDLLMTERRNSSLTEDAPFIVEGKEPFQKKQKYQVEALLVEPLYLVLRGESQAQLSDCEVIVPALIELKREAEARTLNEALSWISREFEPERRSTSGDVFRAVHLLIEKRWQFLGDIRDQYQAQNEANRWAAVGLDPALVKRRTRGAALQTKQPKSPNQ